jgi:MFS family permease
MPLMLAMLVASIIFGAVSQRIGYYTPVGIVGAALMTVGAGLFTTFEVDTSNGRWIGYQILFGFGMGFAMQTPSLATRTVLPKNDVPVGMALGFFFQLLGGAIGVPIATNILNTELINRFSGFPGFDASNITSSGAMGLLDVLPADLRPAALEAYNGALKDVFRVGLILSGLGFLGACGLEWLSILKASGDGLGLKTATEPEPEPAPVVVDEEKALGAA